MDNNVESKLQRQEPQAVKAGTPNLTGIPTQMKLDFEQRSGLSFDDVRVHYNSDKPAQLQALAYTQGTQVYVGPGQERHLPHELGHVFQQKSQKVLPTHYIHGIAVNADPAMERRADILAHRMQSTAGKAAAPQGTESSSFPAAPTVQMFMVGKIINNATNGSRLVITYRRIRPREDEPPAQEGAPAEPLLAAGEGAPAEPLLAAGEGTHAEPIPVTREGTPDEMAAAPETGAPPAAAEYTMAQEANQSYGSESASDEHKFSVLEKIAKLAEEILADCGNTGGPHIALSKVHQTLLISINSYFSLKGPDGQAGRRRADVLPEQPEAGDPALRTVQLLDTNLETAVKQAIYILAQKNGIMDDQLDDSIRRAVLADFDSQNYALSEPEKAWLARIAGEGAITDYRVVALNQNNSGVREIYATQNASVHGEMIIMEHLLENPGLIPSRAETLDPDEFRVIRIGGTKPDCATCNTHFFGGSLVWEREQKMVAAFPLAPIKQINPMMRAGQRKIFAQFKEWEDSGELDELLELRALKQMAQRDPEKAEEWNQKAKELGPSGKLNYLKKLNKWEEYETFQRLLAEQCLPEFGTSYSHALLTIGSRLVRSRGSSGTAFDFVTNFDGEGIFINETGARTDEDRPTLKLLLPRGDR